ncbi:uncharacterized protein LOC119070786 [Bradysia coprophila]|uniref:uncharacterized protein LOC119070786 n=1 Tax=Bradysia coprophila TaxID=38358 RepID=UPI00187DAA88|nr:uncharacterized protein LOC119070786 [Bradysia coprophila]
MIAIIFLCIFFADAAVSQPVSNAGEWAPTHGLYWGILSEVECPNGGKITGIRYRSSFAVERLGFYCTSPEGVETLVGLVGGANDSTCADDKCPKGSYVQSIYGNGSSVLYAFGIKCAEGDQSVQSKVHGGDGGTDFDDASFASNGKRLSAIKVWYIDDLISGVQGKYSAI